MITLAGFVRLVISVYCQAIYGLLYILFIIFVHYHVRRTANTEQSWLGIMRETIANNTLYLILYGMIAGLVGSFLFTVLGIGIDSSLIVWLWPMAVIVLLFDNRYVTLPYVSGIIAFFGLVLKIKSINVPSLMALVAVLYFIKGLLIILDGGRASIPVFIEHKRFKPVGAFIIEKIWPVPLIILTLPAGMLQSPAGGSISMPDWWPLFPGGNGGKDLLMLPLAIILSHRDITATQSVAVRAKNIGLRLFAYSICIFAAAYMSTIFDWTKYIAAILTPLLYEIIQIYSSREQTEGIPLYGAPWRGIRILEALPESPGALMGMKPGDILLKVNGNNVNSMDMVNKILNSSPSYVWAEVKRNRETVVLEYRDYQHGVMDLGIIYVPRQTGRLFELRRRGKMPGRRERNTHF